MTMEEPGLPEEASVDKQSSTGKSITPSSMMANNAATSIANLRKLSDSLLALQCCFTELNQHINSIRSIIHSVIPGLATNISTLLPPAAVSPAPTPATEPFPKPDTNPATEPLSKPEPSWELSFEIQLCLINCEEGVLHHAWDTLRAPTLFIYPT
ncbi:hypothetical protein MTR67_015394 [Solanum verrucosum]|uniref:Uncharacterized protein n=1 Tax=Solanum verrucosum TaxID=315347 RepID=A0AAF0QLC6_SOLVR|nr:hypothetical protein MTR67_015394 [Solanum verrucosum]